MITAGAHEYRSHYCRASQQESSNESSRAVRASHNENVIELVNGPREHGRTSLFTPPSTPPVIRTTTEHARARRPASLLPDSPPTHANADAHARRPKKFLLTVTPPYGVSLGLFCAAGPPSTHPIFPV